MDEKVQIEFYMLLDWILLSSLLKPHIPNIINWNLLVNVLYINQRIKCTATPEHSSSLLYVCLLSSNYLLMLLRNSIKYNIRYHNIEWVSYYGRLQIFIHFNTTYIYDCFKNDYKWKNVLAENTKILHSCATCVDHLAFFWVVKLLRKILKS